MVFLWFSYGFPMVFLWFSYGFPMIFLWFSYGFPMVFLWFSYGFPMVFLWFSYGFPMVLDPENIPFLAETLLPGRDGNWTPLGIPPPRPPFSRPRPWPCCERRCLKRGIY